MAVDEALYLSVKKGLRDYIFRIYAWDKPSITLGYFQKKETLSIKKCIKNQIPLIRRMTGGRAVYHHNELTYSLILKGEETFLKHKIKLFEITSQIILAGLNEMGIHGKITGRTKGELKNPNCFQSTSLCEIINESGDKIVGSAMLIKRDVIMRQGSIPLDDSYKQLSSFFENSSDPYNPPPQLSHEFLQNKGHQFLKGIKKKITLIESPLSNDENNLIEKLIQEKYTNKEWNFMR